MQFGDVITDTQGKNWYLGECLGQGPWGASWSARDFTGREWVLRVPLRAAELPPDLASADRIVQASRNALTELGDTLRTTTHPFLTRLEARVQFMSGSAAGLTALVLPFYPSSFEHRLVDGALSLPDLLHLIRATARMCEALGVHGNVRPSNILLDERGQPVLADPAMPAIQPWRRSMESMSRRELWLPVDADGAPRSNWDIWALSALLYRAVGGDDARNEPLPRRGLQPPRLAAVRALVKARMRAVRGDPNTIDRIADVCGSMLTRGLAPVDAIGPAARFDGFAAFGRRLDELVALVDLAVAVGDEAPLELITPSDPPSEPTPTEVMSPQRSSRAAVLSPVPDSVDSGSGPAAIASGPVDAAAPLVAPAGVAPPHEDPPVLPVHGWQFDVTVPLTPTRGLARLALAWGTPGDPWGSVRAQVELSPWLAAPLVAVAAVAVCLVGGAAVATWGGLPAAPVVAAAVDAAPVAPVAPAVVDAAPVAPAAVDAAPVAPVAVDAAPVAPAVVDAAPVAPAVVAPPPAAPPPALAGRRVCPPIGVDGVVGYAYAGRDAPNLVNGTFVAAKSMTVRADYPRRDNRFQKRAPARCAIAEGMKVQAQPPIQVDGWAYWVPIVDVRE